MGGLIDWKVFSREAQRPTQLEPVGVWTWNPDDADDFWRKSPRTSLPDLVDHAIQQAIRAIMRRRDRMKKLTVPLGARHPFTVPMRLLPKGNDSHVEYLDRWHTCTSEIQCLWIHEENTDEYDTSGDKQNAWRKEAFRFQLSLIPRDNGMARTLNFIICRQDASRWHESGSSFPIWMEQHMSINDYTPFRSMQVTSKAVREFLSVHDKQTEHSPQTWWNHAWDWNTIPSSLSDFDMERFKSSVVIALMECYPVYESRMISPAHGMRTDAVHRFFKYIQHREVMRLCQKHQPKEGSTIYPIDVLHIRPHVPGIVKHVIVEILAQGSVVMDLQPQTMTPVILRSTTQVVDGVTWIVRAKLVPVKQFFWPILRLELKILIHRNLVLDIANLEYAIVLRKEEFSASDVEDMQLSQELIFNDSQYENIKKNSDRPHLLEYHPQTQNEWNMREICTQHLSVQDNDDALQVPWNPSACARVIKVVTEAMGSLGSKMGDVETSIKQKGWKFSFRRISCPAGSFFDDSNLFWYLITAKPSSLFARGPMWRFLVTTQGLPMGGEQLEPEVSRRLHELKTTHLEQRPNDYSKFDTFTR